MCYTVGSGVGVLAKGNILAMNGENSNFQPACLKVGLSPSKKNLCYLLDETRFLFHLKSSFRSQVIQVFVTTFCSCRKSDLIRKLGLTSKFMTSQPDL